MSSLGIDSTNTEPEAACCSRDEDHASRPDCELVDERLADRFLGPEVAVDVAERNTRLARDVRERRAVEALLVNQLCRRVDEPRALVDRDLVDLVAMRPSETRA